MASSHIAPFLVLAIALGGCSGNSSTVAPGFEGGEGNGATEDGGNTQDTNSGMSGSPISMGGAKQQGENPDSTEKPTGEPSVSTAEDYPAGPYGQDNPQVGDVIEDLALDGYSRIGDGVVVGSEPISTIHLSDFRDGEAQYLFIHTATMWCPSCRGAADDLSLEADELSAEGVHFVELVLDGTSTGVSPSNEQLAAWAQGSDLTVTTVREADARTRIVFPAREYVYIVDLKTMEVVWRKQAVFSSPSITEEGLAELRSRL